MRSLLVLRYALAALAIAASLATSNDLFAKGAEAAQTVSSPFSLTIKTKQASVKAQTPVWIEVILENRSDHDIFVWRANVASSDDQGGWVIQADVKNQREEVPPATKFKENIVGGSGGYRQLRPHETISDRINLTKLYQLDRPGEYTIQLKEFDNQSKSFVRSNKIKITVTS